MTTSSLPYAPKSPWERLGMILFLLICFVLGVWALGKGWYEVILLQNEGVTTQGTVVERDASAKGDRQITYRYEAPDPNGIMHTFEHTQFVTRNFFTLPGEPIAIIYLPTRPEISNIEGNRYLLIGDRMWATIILGLVEAFVGMLLILHIREWSTHRKRHGSG